MHRIFFSLGSNLGDKQRNMERAYTEMEKRIGSIVSRSAFYVTEPEGFESGNEFLNSVCEVSSSKDVYAVMEQIREIEEKMGRTKKNPSAGYEDRIIDIDILLFDDRIIEEAGMIVPHPRFHLRDFVLTPFSEISPHTVHPVLNKSVLQLKNELDNRPGG